MEENMKRRISNQPLRISVALAMLAILFLWTGASTIKASSELNNTKIGGIFTLYAMDPLSQSLCFSDAQAGHTFSAGKVTNRCSDIEFGNYRAGSFSVGIEGARLGNIVDLGSFSDLRNMYQYEETVGN